MTIVKEERELAELGASATVMVQDVKSRDFGDNTVSANQNGGDKATYKSYRKKYRKMRIKFEERMRESNDLYLQEQLAMNTAKRLAQQNDQILDVVYDTISSARIPAERRIDLTCETDVPPLVSEEELSKLANSKTPGCKEIYDSIKTILDDKEAKKKATKIPEHPNSKSLKGLMASTPHISLNKDLLKEDAVLTPDAVELLSSFEAPEGFPAPTAYLTPDNLDEYLYEIDASLGDIWRPAPAQPTTSAQQDIVLRNPHSVYNWLRRNEPRVFLQDAEPSEKEKPSAKSGTTRGGAAKRASLPAPSRTDTLEFVEEDGLTYDVSFAGNNHGALTNGGKGKRKREDDEGYTPKSGNPDQKAKKPRPYNRKKKDGIVEGTPTPLKKGKSKKNQSPHETLNTTFVNTTGMP